MFISFQKGGVWARVWDGRVGRTCGTNVWEWLRRTLYSASHFYFSERFSSTSSVGRAQTGRHLQSASNHILVTKHDETREIKNNDPSHMSYDLMIGPSDQRFFPNQQTALTSDLHVLNSNPHNPLQKLVLLYNLCTCACVELRKAVQLQLATRSSAFFPTSVQ